MKKYHRYTKEQIDYIRKIANKRTLKEIHRLVTDEFGINITIKSLKGIMYRNGIKCNMQGYKTRFKKGHKPWNKNKKGLYVGNGKGWFKKGNKPPSHRPVGSEVVNEGVVFIKVAEPNIWSPKHRYIWEKHHGKIPDGKVIRFKDGNPMNVVLDNLFMVSRSVCTSVVRRKMEKDDPKLNVLSHKLAELDLKIKEKEND